MEKQEETQTEHTSHSYSIYILVWLGLLTLTALTTVVAGINFGALTIAIALIIASTKSYLVLTIFMHLRIEQTAFKIFIFVAMAFLIISFILLFSDYSFLQGFIK
jgi:cytochrome c oxidase subunit IV